MTRRHLLVAVAAVAMMAASCNGELTGSSPANTDVTVQLTSTTVDQTIQALAEACADNQFTACDELWEFAAPGSDEAFLGASCNGRIIVGETALFGDCVATFVSVTTVLDGATSTTVSGTIDTQPEDTDEPQLNTWNVILASMSTDFPIDEAVRYRDDLIAEDILDTVGVFKSDGFGSLNPGFWVVYTGPYTDQDAAAVACDGLLEIGLECYARFIGDE